MSSTYPFRFYGLIPGDWMEGANVGHAYEVHFAEAPKAATKKAIATAFETSVATLPVNVDDERAQWWWSGEWATFLVGEPAGESKARETFAAMGEVCKAIHAVAPLVEVVYHGVRERGKDPWTTWSVAQQPAPSAAPDWPGLDFTNDVFGAMQERLPLKAKRDATFEKTRESTRTKLRKAETKAAAAKAIKRGKPALVPVTDAPKTAANEHAKLFGADARIEVAAGRTIAFDGYHADAVIAWVEGGKATTVKVPWLEASGIHPDGTRIVYSANKVIYELSIPGGKAVELLDCSRGDRPCGVAYGPEDTILVASDKHLSLCRREGKTLETVHWIEAPASGVETYKGGTLAVVRTYKKRAFIYSVTPTTFDEIASFKSEAYTSFEIDGRIYLANAQVTTELVNV